MTTIILHEKYSHEKLNDDELYREVLVYKVDGKISCMMSVIESDRVSRAYNMDSDTYFNPKNHEDYSDEIPKDVLAELVTLSCKQIEADYKASMHNKTDAIDYTTLTTKEIMDAFLLYLDDSLPTFSCEKITQKGNSECHRCDLCMMNQYLQRIKAGEQPKIVTENNGVHYPTLNI